MRKATVDKKMLRRDAHGNSTGLLKKLAVEDQLEYKEFMRTAPDQFIFRGSSYLLVISK